MCYFRDIFFIIILFCYNLIYTCGFSQTTNRKMPQNSLKLVWVPPKKNHKQYCTTLTNPLELVHYAVNPIHRKYILVHNTTQPIFALDALLHSSLLAFSGFHFTQFTLPLVLHCRRFFFASLTTSHCLLYFTTNLSQSLYHVTFSTFCSPSLGILHILCPYLHVCSFISALTWRRTRYLGGHTKQR